MTAKKKRKKKARRSILRLLRDGWFYRIYFGLLALCAVALAVGLYTLNGVMREYEQTRPVHAAEEALEMFESGDWAGIRELDESAKKLKYETPEQYVQYMEKLADGKAFALKSVISLEDNEQKYNVMMDGQKLAEVTLEQSGEATAHNFKYWKVKDLRTLAFVSNEFTITAPADSTVQVNGRTLGAEDVLEAGIATEAAGNLPDGVAAPTMTKYGVYMALGAPEEIRVTDRNGSVQEVAQQDERSWSCELAWDDAEVKEMVEKPVVQWGRRLAAYTTGDYGKIDLSNACINPSPARTYIRNMENQWAAKHDGYDFQNMQTFDYYVYADSCFSCKISFDYIVHYAQGDKVYPTKYTLYFAKDGGTFKLYSFTMD